MYLKNYFNSGSEKQEPSSETSTSGIDPKKIRDDSLDDSNIPDDVFTEELSSPTVLIFYITVFRMLKNNYKAFTLKQKKPK